MKKVLPEVVFNSTIITLQYLIKILNIKVTTLSIRQAICESEIFPEVTLAFLIKQLDHWKIKSLPMKFDKDLLSEITPPFISLVGQTNEAPGVYIVVTAVTSSYIYYFMPGDGLHKEEIDSFQNKAVNGFMLAIEAGPESGEENFNDQKLEEQNLKKKYQSSIQVIDTFLTPQECDHIIKYSIDNNLFSRSMVSTPSGEHIIAPVRTSSSAMLHDREEKTFKSIYERVAALTQVPIIQIESLQCVRYTVGDKFTAHFDADGNNKRVSTILVYLNDDFTAGETFFPELDLRIKPKKGTALYFTNLTENNEKILFSLHEGLPVTEGVKYACNIWVTNSGSEVN